MGDTNGLTQERLAYLDLMREIEDFLYAEVDLMDERKYDEWLDLLTEDIVYWMPMRKNVSFKNRDADVTAENDLAWIHDDKDTLRKRVKQIQTGIHWADEPISRVWHLITNIRLVDPISLLDEGAKTMTKCRFIVYRNRVEDETDLQDIAAAYPAPQSRFLVAVENDSVVATAGLARVSESDCELRRLYVLESHRRRGIASALMVQVLAIVKGQGYRRILLELQPEMKETSRVYARYGFLPVPSSESLPRDGE